MAGIEVFRRLFRPKSTEIAPGQFKGTLFTDVQRRIGIYLRALWDSDFHVMSTGRDFGKSTGHLPFVEGQSICLPEAYRDFLDVSGGEIFRAAAAHVVYADTHYSTRSLDNWKIAVIGVIEDARVESLAIREFPGLKRLWARLHRVGPENSGTAGDYLSRLARALLDERYRDEDPWIVMGRELFMYESDNLESEKISMEIGIKLAESFDKSPFRQGSDFQDAPYRDDNRHIWEPGKPGFAKAARKKARNRVRKYASFFGMTNEVASESDAEKKVSVISALFNFKLDFGNISEKEKRESDSAPFHYPEWDFLARIERQSWVLVLEKRAKSGDIRIIHDIIARHRHLISRMKVLLDAIQPEGAQRIRKLEEGDDIDINAAVRAQTDIRLGLQPDTRIMMSTVRKTRDISVLVLLDLSKSTNQKVRGQDHTVLELTRQACVLLADAIEKVGDPFAIHGFCSDSRHHVEYYRFKDFGQPYDDASKARLAGMTGQLSTRMGAAIRHSAYYLGMQKSSKKLLMVITDGEPSDVDVRENHKYLQYDAKRAVEEAGRSGIITYCMNLDANADQYVSRIFGQRRYMVIDHVARLPEKLPLLYAGLTR